MVSILNDVKKVVNIPEADTSFDLDIILHINSVFSKLEQLGVGPDGGYAIESHEEEWDEYITTNSLNMIKSFMCLSVRMLFDPPTTSFLIDAVKEEIKELTWRISTDREWSLDPVDPALVTE